jgi:NAD(P)-dependent dehydrogenase (short-subunit alcohol dehydrogenase family)
MPTTEMTAKLVVVSRQQTALDIASSAAETSTGALQGRVALVTGASRGIGAATSHALARAGAAVILAARDEPGLKEHVRQIEAAGGQALAIPTDVRDEPSVQRLVDQALTTFGRLDMACNNAGSGGRLPTALADLSVEDFDNDLRTNLRGVFLSLKYEIPGMLRSGGGAIVNMASTTGLEAVAGLAGYVSSKHGIIGLTKTAALDYAAQGVRVNAVAPGPILTDRLAAAGETAQLQAGMAMPLRRIGRPDEVAAAVVWLCSEASSFVTGAVLPIDGGKLAGTPPFNRAGARAAQDVS